MTKIIKSPLKWVGAKSWQVPIVKTIFDQYKSSTWLDPFCGGCSLPLNLQVEKAILGDINAGLINFWKQLQNKEHFYSINWIHFEDYYYKNRDVYNELHKGLKTDETLYANCFYYLNKIGFRGMYRENRCGEFNVPYGYYKKPSLNIDFEYYSRIIKNWEFMHTPYNKLLENIPQKALIYLDPPYTGTFNQYNANQFSTKDVECFLEIDYKNNSVIACNSVYADFLYKERNFDTYHILSNQRMQNGRNTKKEIYETFAIKNIDKQLLKPFIEQGILKQV